MPGSRRQFHCLPGGYALDYEVRTWTVLREALWRWRDRWLFSWCTDATWVDTFSALQDPQVCVERADGTGMQVPPRRLSPWQVVFSAHSHARCFHVPLLHGFGDSSDSAGWMPEAWAPPSTALATSPKGQILLSPTAASTRDSTKAFPFSRSAWVLSVR